VKIVIPNVDNRIIAWIYKESFNNLWRVGAWYDFEDLVQDGLIIALNCHQRYPDAELPQFIALVKISFRNHIVNLTRKPTEIYREDYQEELPKRVSLPEQEIACVFNELPESIKAVLRLFLSEESLRRLRQPLRETLTDSETPAKRLKRLAGWPEDKDFASELQKLLFPG